MLGDIRQARNIYIVCGYTDMRKGLNSLVPFVQQNFGIDPYSGSLFLFCGKRCDRLKALLWEPDGFVLLYKRLDNGRYQWPRNAQEVKPLTWEQFTWLMQGLNIEQPRAIRPGRPKELVISTEDTILGEYFAGNAAVFQGEILTFGRRFLLVYRLFSQYNGKRKYTREERRHESGHKKSSAGSGGIYPVAGGKE